MTSTGTQESTRRQHRSPADRAIFQPRRIFSSKIDLAGLLALGRNYWGLSWEAGRRVVRRSTAYPGWNLLTELIPPVELQGGELPGWHKRHESWRIGTSLLGVEGDLSGSWGWARSERVQALPFPPLPPTCYSARYRARNCKTEEIWICPSALAALRPGISLSSVSLFVFAPCHPHA